MPDPALISTQRIRVGAETVRGTSPVSGARFTLPIIQGSQGTIVRNYERSNIIRADRQGGAQIGGTRYAQGTLILPLLKWDAGGIEMLFESLFTGATSGNILKPSSARKFFTVECRYQLGDGTFTYEMFRGCEVTDATVTLPTSGGASVSMNFLGTKTAVFDNSSTSTSRWGGDDPAFTDTEAPSTSIQMAGSATGSLLEIGTQGGTFDVDTNTAAESLTINYTNNAAVKFAVGNAEADHITLGDFDVTTNFNVYYKGKAMTDRFVAGTRFRMKTTVSDGTNDFLFDLPKLVVTSGEKGASDQTLTESINAFGEYDGTAGILCKASIDFAP